MKTNTLKLLLLVLLLTSFGMKETYAQVVPAPTPVAPVSGSGGQSLTPELQWSFSLLGLLATYRVQVATDAAFSNIILDVPGVTTSNYTIPSGNLLPNTRYYWRVNATVVLPLGGLTTSAYSSVSDFLTAVLTGLQPIAGEIPGEYKLYNNYPNPFNPSTKIKFDLAQGGFTVLAIYNLAGEQVTTIVSENLAAGSYEAQWNAGGIPSGAYFYRISTGAFSVTKRMMLVK